MRVFVINLDRDVERWASISAALKQYPTLHVERIQGIYGPDIPSAAALLLGGHSLVLRHRGTLGTFLSHVKAWEAIAASAEPFGMVMEDDAVLLGFDRVEALNIPADADLVFINDRMSPGSRYAPPETSVRGASISESLRTLNRTGFGVGGDGYILKASGARTLLEAIAKDRFFGHVDWRLLRYSLVPDDLGGEFKDTRVASIILHHHNPTMAPAWGIVKAYCITSPLVAFATGGTSTREKADVVS